jgi:hypothetical protein
MYEIRSLDALVSEIPNFYSVGPDLYLDMSKSTKLWLTLAGSVTIYLIWKFVFHLWPLG